MLSAIEIPTQIPFSLYLSLLIICLLIIIGFSLKVPTTKLHYMILIIISIIFILIPIKYGRQFSCIYNLPIPVTMFGCFYKMLIWIKKCKQNIKNAPPFFLTLFFWRKNDYTYQSYKKTKLNKKLNIKKELNSYLIKKLLKLFFMIIFNELCLYFLETFPPMIPERPYPLRLIDYLLLNKKTFITTPYTLFYCYIYAGFLIHNMNYIYNRILLVATLILWVIQNKFFTFNSSVNSKVSIIKKYLISLLFNTLPLFNQPYFSTSPSDLWGRRWHQMLRECFFELGYLPISSLFNNSKLGHIMGLMASFICSGVFHEYLMISLFSKTTGEHFTFFLFQGIMIILWESILLIISKFIIERKLASFLIWNIILIFSIPWFIEPYIRLKHFNCIYHIIN